MLVSVPTLILISEFGQVHLFLTYANRWSKGPRNHQVHIFAQFVLLKAWVRPEFDHHATLGHEPDNPFSEIASSFYSG